jgi:hypothetical protein
MSIRRRGHNHLNKLALCGTLLRVHGLRVPGLMRNVVPVAVLSGVYKLHNLMSAQTRGLTLYWAHDLVQLLDWIEAGRHA